MNKNLDIIINALDKKIDLSTLRLSGNLKQLNLSDRTIDKLQLSSCDFSYSNLNNITFKNCKFVEIQFENNIFLNCHFIDCTYEMCEFINEQYDNCSFGNTNFKNNIFSKSNFKTSEFINTFFSDVDLFNINSTLLNISACKFNKTVFYYSNFVQTKFELSDLTHVSFHSSFFDSCNISKNDFKKAIFKKNNFLQLTESENIFNKVLLLNCKGTTPEFNKLILEGGGRTETLFKKLFKNNFFKFFSISLIVIMIIFSYMVIKSDYYIYSRYIIKQAWMDITRMYLQHETNVLFNITFKNRKIINDFNNAIIQKNKNNLQTSKEYFYSCLKKLDINDKNYIDICFWFINEILLVTTSDDEWNQSVIFFENLIPKEYSQDLRIYLLKIYINHPFSETTLKILQRFLINSGNDIQSMIKVMNVMREIPYFTFTFKPHASQMLRSFILRKLKNSPQHEKILITMKEEVDEWIEYYAPYFSNFKK